MKEYIFREWISNWSHFYINFRLLTHYFEPLFLSRRTIVFQVMKFIPNRLNRFSQIVIKQSYLFCELLSNLYGYNVERKQLIQDMLELYSHPIRVKSIEPLLHRVLERWRVVIISNIFYWTKRTKKQIFFKKNNPKPMS